MDSSESRSYESMGSTASRCDLSKEIPSNAARLSCTSIPATRRRSAGGHRCGTGRRNTASPGDGAFLEAGYHPPRRRQWRLFACRTGGAESYGILTEMVVPLLVAFEGDGLTGRVQRIPAVPVDSFLRFTADQDRVEVQAVTADTGGRRDVADVETTATLRRRVGLRAVQQVGMVDRHVAGVQLDVYDSALFDPPVDQFLVGRRVEHVFQVRTRRRLVEGNLLAPWDHA